jgi:ABC-type multidrug transport system fused ATPase/permease subunit
MRVIERPIVVRRLLRTALRERTAIAIAAAGLVLLSATQLYVTWLIKQWVEGPILAHDTSQFRPLMIRAVIAASIGMASLFASRYALAVAGQRMVESLRDQGMNAILRARVNAVRSASSGEWLSRLFNDVNILSTFLGTVARRMIAETIILCGSIVLMFVLSWRLALAMLIVVPLTGWALVRMGRRIRRWGTFSQEAAASLTSTIGEQLAGFTTVKTYQAEALMQEQVRREAEALRRRVLRAELWSAALVSVVFLIGGIALMAILVLGTAQVRQAAIDQATFLAFCLYAGQTVEPARRLSEVHGLLQQSIAAGARVFEVIDLGPAEDEEVATSRPLRSGAVHFDRVSFAYRDGQDVLRDLSFQIGDAEIVGLVGASGCGKSTLARLIVGFDEARSGTVAIDGCDVRALSRRDLRAAVCVVEQDPFVFSGPLIDNIRLGRPDAPRDVIDEAVAMTGLDAVIRPLRHGLDSPLREAGRDLSGGQRQRIALARAIVRNPRLLILDEAMSAIDSESESATFAAMLPWLRRRTVIVVSHRLATVARLPRILLIDSGAIAADDQPRRLLEGSPTFRMLFADQIEQIQIPAVPA